jgi:hypothetical protein
MEDDKRWITQLARLSPEFQSGLTRFLEFVRIHCGNCILCCPCKECRNLKQHTQSMIAEHIAAKAFRAGFYWLTSIEDAKYIVRRCEACQRFASRPHDPMTELQPILLSWPFAQWGLDMVGKLHKSWLGGHVYTLVAVDKFTKWIEGTPVTT